MNDWVKDINFEVEGRAPVIDEPLQTKTSRDLTEKLHRAAAC